MAEKLFLVVFFKDSKGNEQEFVNPMSFSGKLSVLVDRVPSILRDIFEENPRPNLRLRAMWWNNEQWETRLDLEVNDSFENCLLIMVDEKMVSKGTEYWSNTGESTAMARGVIPRRYKQGSSVVTMKAKKQNNIPENIPQALLRELLRLPRRVNVVLIIIIGMFVAAYAFWDSLPDETKIEILKVVTKLR